MEARIEVRSCVPRVMNHASSSPRSELERAAAVRPVREINNVICSLGSRPIHSGPKDFYQDCDGRTSGESPCFRNPQPGDESHPSFSPLRLVLSHASFCPSFHLCSLSPARSTREPTRTLTARTVNGRGSSRNH